MESISQLFFRLSADSVYEYSGNVYSVLVYGLTCSLWKAFVGYSLDSVYDYSGNVYSVWFNMFTMESICLLFFRLSV